MCQSAVTDTHFDQVSWLFLSNWYHLKRWIVPLLWNLKFLTIPLVAKNNLFLYFPSERSIDSVWKSYFEWFGQRSDPEHSFLTRVDTSNLGPEPANMDL